MHIVGGEWTYRWQRTETSRHEFSPLTVKYQFMNSRTLKFDSIVKKNPYLERTMGDFFIPKMRYTYLYTSPKTLDTPSAGRPPSRRLATSCRWSMQPCGRSFNEKEKKLAPKNPYAQFVRLETDFTETWSVGTQSSLVGHINTGIMFCLRQQQRSPFSEEFYVGGANSVRALRYPRDRTRQFRSVLAPNSIFK